MNNECFDKLLLCIGFKDTSDTISAITRHLTSKASWVQDQQWVSFPDIRFAKFGGGGKTGRHVLLKLFGYDISQSASFPVSCDLPVVGVMRALETHKPPNGCRNEITTQPTRQ